VTLPDNLEISGVVLADQIKSLDWRAREAQIACKAPEPITAEVLGKVVALLGLCSQQPQTKNPEQMPGEIDYS